MSKVKTLVEAVKSGELKELPHNTFPGAYPLYYVTEHGDILCPTCANKHIDEVTNYDAYMEGEPIVCDDCGAHIESAYGDPEEEES